MSGLIMMIQDPAADSVVKEPAAVVAEEDRSLGNSDRSLNSLPKVDLDDYGDDEDKNEDYGNSGIKDEDDNGNEIEDDYEDEEEDELEDEYEDEGEDENDDNVELDEKISLDLESTEDQGGCGVGDNYTV